MSQSQKNKYCSGLVIYQNSGWQGLEREGNEQLLLRDLKTAR
jgi:hypothetical protein